MKPKTARRFLNRNKWKIAALKVKPQPNSFLRRLTMAKVTLGKLDVHQVMFSPLERFTQMLGL